VSSTLCRWVKCCPAFLTNTAGLRVAIAAVYSLICLRILGKHSDKAKRHIVTDESLELLEKARFAGLATNLVLAEEAKESYQVLTEDVRSC